MTALIGIFVAFLATVLFFLIDNLIETREVTARYKLRDKLYYAMMQNRGHV